MENFHRLLGKFFALLIITALVFGCAITPFMNVNYKSSEPSDIFDGQKVYIDFKDVRSDQAFLGKEAQSYLKYFNGRFHLMIDRNDKKKKSAGSYGLKNLFRETLNLRLRHHGVQIVEIKSEKTTVMEIKLKKFTLDLKSNYWITSIEYAARLVYGKGGYVGENISATAERLKIWGKKEAEKTLSVAITDAVNKLDIQRLFEKGVR
ncbi:hypothetical protein ACFLZM_01905 [Thermodesulfobacteriota bacterium]